MDIPGLSLNKPSSFLKLYKLVFNWEQKYLFVLAIFAFWWKLLHQTSYVFGKKSGPDFSDW